MHGKSKFAAKICPAYFCFKGKASHAAAAPWEGINALDAAVACYNSVSMLRQQTKPTNRIHGIIVDGGEKPNIIPERSEMEYYVRGLKDEDVKELKEKVVECAKGAAIATGIPWIWSISNSCHNFGVELNPHGCEVN